MPQAIRLGHRGELMETTFSIIKPNAVKKNAIGDIIAIFEKEKLV